MLYIILFLRNLATMYCSIFKTLNTSEEEMKQEHILEYETVIADYKDNNKNIIRDNPGLEGLDNAIRHRLIIALSKTIFTIFFLVVCLWMLWISYSTLMEAVTLYVI